MHNPAPSHPPSALPLPPTGWSALSYPVATHSLQVLPVAKPTPLPPRLQRALASGEPIVLLGRNRADPNGVAPQAQPDTLIAGLPILQRALDENRPFLPVRFAFHGYDPSWLRWPLHLCATYKRRVYYVGSHTYEIDFPAFQRLHLPRHTYTRETAYLHCSRFRRRPPADRLAEFDKLTASMSTNGFDPGQPLRVMLRRSFGLQDTLRDGHHRYAVAKTLALPRITLRFTFAGHAPQWLLEKNDE